MDITEFKEWSQKAQAMTLDQQRACIHSFDPQVLVEEIWVRLQWMNTFQQKQAKLNAAFSMENYYDGPFVESAYIKKLFYDVPITQEKQAIEETKEVEVDG